MFIIFFLYYIEVEGMFRYIIIWVKVKKKKYIVKNI